MAAPLRKADAYPQRPIAIIGAGGHARVLLEILNTLGRRVLFITDDSYKLHGQSVVGAEVRGGQESIEDCSPDEIDLVNGIGSVTQPVVRKQVYQRFVHRGYRFATVIHPTATIARTATIAEGAQIMAGAIVQNHALVGANTLLNTRSIVEHDCTIEAHVHLSPGVALSGSVSVGQTTHIGTGASVIQGTRIGHEALIGAGAVVTRDIAAGEVVYGIPARTVR